MKNVDLTDNRIKWIDCAKAVAIIAVVLDHCNGLLYTNALIAQSSYFSVSLFVLLSGMSANLSSSNRKKTYAYQLKKVGLLYAQYALATFILLIFYTHMFDLKTYILHLLNFSIQGPYYFLVFFFQLMLISPILLSWHKICNSQKWNGIWHIATILFLCFCSSLFIRFTYILPVHGGGKYLFGGTYIILYYLGILFADARIFKTLYPPRHRILILIISSILYVTWLLMGANGSLPFDQWLMPYYGNGFNPPSVRFIVFSIITLFVLYSLFSLLEENTWEIIQQVVDLFSFIGKHTLYVFMYHLFVKDMILKYFSAVLVNKWAMRICIFVPMIVAPVITVYLVKRIRHILIPKEG